MTLEQLIFFLPIIAFIALASGLVVVFRGTARIAARTREIQRFRSSVKDLAARADRLLATAAGQIDAVRHNTTGPEGIGQVVTDATEALQRFSEEARGWSGPRRTQAIRDDLVAELERAIRALGMVEHGANILGSARRGTRDLEAQTSIKRGYLNLIHAREAIATHAMRGEELLAEETRVGRTRFGV